VTQGVPFNVDQNINLSFNMNSAGPSWEECEKENLFCKTRKAELETLVTFLSKFDSKVAAIWDGGDRDDAGVMNKGQAVWEQPQQTAPMETEDLLISPKTHFKPIRDYREEIPPPLAFLPFPQQDPVEYAVYNRTANSSFPLQFKIKTENDKAVQTDFSPPSSFQLASPFSSFLKSSSH